MVVNKQVNCKLVGTDGNAFALMGNWQRAARKEKWTQEEINAVINDAMSGDYSHLVATLSKHCKNGGM